MVRFENVLESRAFELKRPRRLCTPVAVDGSDIKTPGRHVLGYPAKRAKFSPTHVPVSGVATDDGVFPDLSSTVTEDEICVPSSLVGP